MKEAAYYVSGLSGLYRQTHPNRMETPLSVTYAVQINIKTRKKRRVAVMNMQSVLGLALN